MTHGSYPDAGAAWDEISPERPSVCGCPDAHYDLHVAGGCSWFDDEGITE